MKPIYIRTERPKPNRIWILALALILFVVGLSARVLAPFAIEAWINGLPPDENGRVIKVSHVDLQLLQGLLILRDLDVVSPEGPSSILEAGRIELSLRPGFFWEAKRSVKIKAWDVSMILSGGDIAQVRDEILEHFKTLDVRLTNVMLKEVDQNIVRTLLSLSDVRLSFDQDQAFKMTTKIKEGGKLSLTGSRGTIQGELAGIGLEVLTKLAGDQKSFVVTGPTLTVRIKAAMSGNIIQGNLLCDNNDLRSKSLLFPPAPRRRSHPNVVLEQDADILIPFTFQETLSFDFPAAAEELQRRGL